MDPSEMKEDAPAGGEGAEARSELQSLRSLVAAALVLMIVFTVCVDYYLSAQTSEMGKVAYQEQMAARKFSAFSVQAGNFWAQLVEYSKTDPGFAPIVNKWKNNFRFSTNGPAK